MAAMNRRCKKETAKTALVIWHRGRSVYCPHCKKEIEYHKVDNYCKPEKHPCEHCGKDILWEPMFDISDIRD